MRAGASSRLIAVLLLLAAVVGLGSGCSSRAKQHYLHHLSLTIAPISQDSELVAAFEPQRIAAGRQAIAAVDPQE